MEAEALSQIDRESLTWLNQGRRRLLFLTLQREITGDAEILEVGAGYGSNLQVITKFGKVDVLETNASAIERLREHSEVRTVYTEPLPFSDVSRKYDVICALDVLEHVENDAAAARWIIDHLRPGGILIATVPAYQWFFSQHDIINHHFRRYTASQLAGLFPADIKIKQISYFNALLLPLAVASRIIWHFTERRQDGRIEKQSATIWGPIDGLFRSCLFGEAWFIRSGGRLPFGLSVFCVIRRD